MFNRLNNKLNTVKKLILRFSFFTGVLILTSCGFQLRGDYLLPDALQTLNVTSVDKHGELTRVLKQHLKINQVNLVSSSKISPTNNAAFNYAENNHNIKPVPELRILKDKLDRRTLSVFPNGQVAEYELIYTVKYQLLIAGKAPQTFEFELNRDYQEDPDFALAKSRELKLLLSEMRQIAADRILRSMASIQL